MAWRQRASPVRAHALASQSAGMPCTSLSARAPAQFNAADDAQHVIAVYTAIQAQPRASAPPQPEQACS